MIAVGSGIGTEWLIFKICFSCVLMVDVFSPSRHRVYVLVERLHSKCLSMVPRPAAFDLERHDTFEG